MTDESSLWAAIDEAPEDQVRRLVLADWYEEHAGTVRCVACTDGVSYSQSVWRPSACTTCSGTGIVSDGRADLAAALRATADRVPTRSHAHPGRSWILATTKTLYLYLCSVPVDVFGNLSGITPQGWPSWRDYPTAAAAIRDLCRAWCVVHLKRKVTT